MREKELRIALVCYGGISLAVYMHGVTKEVWRLARASRARHAANPDPAIADSAYSRLLDKIAAEADVDLRVLVDILAGASAGGINAVFLSHAIVTGQPLDPLTDLWLDSADVDELLDSESGLVSRLAKSAAVPLAWMLSKRSGAVADTVDEEQRDEIRAKLANLVRARWMSPPFGGPKFTNLLLDAFEAMAKAPPGDPLLPVYQPLDLFVTVTDFRGYPAAAPAQFAAGDQRARASPHPLLPGQGRRRPALRRPDRAGLRRPRHGELPRRLPALHRRRARQGAGRARHDMAGPRRLPRPRAARPRRRRRL